MFKENGFEVIRNAVSEDACVIMSHEFRMIRKCESIWSGKSDQEYFQKGDEQVELSYAMYGLPFSEALTIRLTSLVENVVGEKLHPCYSYARAYYTGATMSAHIDRPSCQYSVTLCLDWDRTDWPIGIKDYAGNDHLIQLDPGDLIIYNGSELTHWRDEYAGNEQLQCFLHYVVQDGPFDEMKYDTRPYMGTAPDLKNQDLIYRLNEKHRVDWMNRNDQVLEDLYGTKNEG